MAHAQVEKVAWKALTVEREILQPSLTTSDEWNETHHSFHRIMLHSKDSGFVNQPGLGHLGHRKHNGALMQSTILIVRCLVSFMRICCAWESCNKESPKSKQNSESVQEDREDACDACKDLDRCMVSLPMRWYQRWQKAGKARLSFPLESRRSWTSSPMRASHMSRRVVPRQSVTAMRKITQVSKYGMVKVQFGPISKIKSNVSSSNSSFLSSNLFYLG